MTDTTNFQVVKHTIGHGDDAECLSCGRRVALPDRAEFPLRDNASHFVVCLDCCADARVSKDATPLIVEFTVPGRPIPFKRHAGVGRRAHNPAEYTAWKETVGWAARLAMGGREPVAHKVAVGVRVRLADLNHGDFDNYVKAVCDAMQGIVFENDKQVWRWIDDPEMVLGRDNPGVDVVVRDMGRNQKSPAG